MLGVAVLLSGCSTLGLVPDDPIVPLAASASVEPDAEPDAEPDEHDAETDAETDAEPDEVTDVCWAMLQDLPVMDDSSLDPEDAAFFVAWGRYMRDVDRYLNQRIPVLEMLIEQAPSPEQPAMDASMEGILRMRAAVHGAARRLMQAQDPVDMGLMRAFTVASTDFLDGLEAACPSAGMAEAGTEVSGSSIRLHSLP